MQAIETALNVRRVKAARIRFWFGRKKGFPRVEQLAAIAEHGAPVHVEGSTDIGAALAYSNNRSVAPHSDIMLAKICLLYTSPSPRDGLLSRMPSSA